MRSFILNDQKLTIDSDAEQLKALGYSSRFDRSMSKWENFSLGFTYLSPVVGVYSVFALALQRGGPPMWWSYLIVGFFQMLVCLVFCEVVAQFPISGGLYPWARRLVGKRWAWMTGWIYAWALCATISAVATGGAPFVAALIGLSLGTSSLTLLAIAMIAVVTILNLSGTRLLARIAFLGFICEILGALVVGGYLLLFARHHPLSILFDTTLVPGSTSYWSAFVASAVAAMFCYYGFEACGDVAEETPNAGREIPKAMRMTIYVGGAAAMFVCLALILAVPDLPAAMNGSVSDPVATTFIAALGVTGFRVVIVVVLVSFVSCLLSLQAAASRLLFAYGRDQMIIGSAYFSRLSRRTHVPSFALLVVGVVPSVFALVGLWLTHAIATIISFASAGIYIAFQMLVLGALIARVRGWRPAGSFRLGIWAIPVNVIALFYGIAAVVDMVWPRAPQDPWYSNYGMIVGTAAIICSGLSYMLLLKPHDRGQAPSGDAHLLNRHASESAGGRVYSAEGPLYGVSGEPLDARISRDN
jgi:amino acid transporter